MSERDRLARELLTAEAEYAALYARVGQLTSHPAFARWLTESQTNITKLRERLGRLNTP